ncbi:MAG: 30S ribosomal protein S17e [Candidatus Aenigmatarchaeota archaeon]|nr:30S ribosomal protein S17e [Candidatus Aenigmarchaeota archaeon]
MGRVRTDFIKRLAEKLVETYPDKFGTDYTKNKAALKELKIINEKFTRNKVAGYIVRVASRKRY